MEIGHHLERDTETLAGAVRVRGTRLSVDFILELFQAGWTDTSIRENYPQLTPEVLAEVFAFARQTLHSEQIISIAPQPGVKILCDESVPLVVERALIAAAHDVQAVRVLMPEATIAKFSCAPFETVGCW